jgi:phage-related minor tail protein
MTVVGSAEFEVRANRSKLANDLREQEREVKASLDRTERQATQQLTKLQRASRLNLTRQGADVFTSAAGGASPSMIAFQQGPQILDALATSGIRASGALVGLGAGLSAAAAGVVLLAAAWQKGEESSLAYEKAATGVGRTANLTAGQLEALTKAAAEQGEVSVKAAREQAIAYLSTGQIGGEAISSLIELGKDYASFMGIDAADATKQLAKAMLDPKKAGEDLTLQFGLLTQEQLKQIDVMVEAGDLLGAQRVLYEQLDRAVDGHAESLGTIESAWDAIGRSISNAVQAVGEYFYTTEDERFNQIVARRGAIERERQLTGGRDRDPRARKQYEDLGREGSAILAARARRSANSTASIANQNAERDRRRAEESATRTRIGGGSTRSSGISSRASDTLRDLSSQREALQLQMQISLLRAKGLSDEAEAVQRRLDVLSLTKQLESAGVENAAVVAQEQVDALTEAEARQRGLNNAREHGQRYLDVAVEAQRRNNDQALERVRYEAQLAGLRGDPKIIEAAERELYIAERVNALLRDKEGLITAADLAAATAQATSEADTLGSAEREGMLRDEFKRSFVDGMRAALDGDVAGLFESLADRFTDRMLENLADDLFNLMKNAGGSGGGNFLSSITSLFSKGIPGFATGGSISKGGLAYVHQGEVLANLSAGTSVIPAHAVRAMGGMAGSMGGASAGGPYFDLRGAVMTQDLLEQMNQIGRTSESRANHWSTSNVPGLSQSQTAKQQQHTVGRKKR